MYSVICTITAALVTSRLDYAHFAIYGILAKYISDLQCIQNTLARVVAGNRTSRSNLATLSQLHWLPVHDCIKFRNAKMTYIAIHTGNSHILLIWSIGTLRAEIYDLPLPTVSLLLILTSHLVLEVFARQQMLYEIVSPLTSVLVKLSQHSADT